MSPIIIIPHFPVLQVDADVSVTQFYLPEVIIWDPLCQFPALFMNKIPPTCTEKDCRLLMKHVVWQDGSSRRYYPRCIYGSRGCVVLVCQIYRCARGHFMTSCDPRILQHFTRKEVIPFILLHKSGVTRELQLQIFRLCSQGRSFSDIRMLLLWSVQDDNAQRMMYEHHTSSSQQTEHQSRLVSNSYMSIDFITNIFLLTFHDFRTYMYQEMYDLTSEYISCDHTFKLASHIGILREGKWIPQYDSLFIIQNERGQILFWQLTMGTAYGSINDGMVSLKSRMSTSLKSLKMIIIDNCCMWRKKLHESFGSGVEVKLDLFHAVKRVTTALSKRHPYFYPAMQDFRLVFRRSGDCGIHRTKSTPPPSVIHKNIDQFFSKWGKITDSDGRQLITSAVTHEIQNLLIHVDKGCLSEIPPNFGTNRNENLHRSLNKRLSGTRLGVEVAVALLATFFHVWNSRHGVSNKTTSVWASYISDFLSTDVRVTTAPKFGIGVSSERSHSYDNVERACIKDIDR